MLEGAQAIFPLLLQRRWSVLLSPAGRFVCSDRPVVVVFTRPKPPIWAPGFGLPDTEVTVPISKNVMLVGSWDGVPATISLTYRQIARYNSRTIQHASRFAFSAQRDVPWLDRQNKTRTNLLEASPSYAGRRSS